MRKDNLQLLIIHLSNAKDWLLAEELASYMHTTTRTIRNYIQEINKNSGEQPLVLSSKMGYRINTKHTLIREFYIARPALPQTPEERYDYIIRRMLNQKLTSIPKLCDSLGISDRTLEADLIKIKIIFREYNLNIHRRKDDLYISGREIDKRRLCIYCIKKTSEIEILTYNFIETAFPGFDVGAIRDILVRNLEKNTLAINGYTFYDMLLLLMVQLYMIRINSVIREPEFSISDIGLYPDYQAALGIAKELNDSFGIVFHQEEINYLCGVLISKTNTLDYSNLIASDGFVKLQRKVVSSLEMAGNHIGCDFTREDFPLKLTCFFQRLIILLKLKLFSHIPLHRKMRDTYPVLYDVATFIIDDITREYTVNFNRDEITFLVFHLGSYMQGAYLLGNRIPCILVCPTYYDLTSSIADNITSHTNNSIEIVKILETPDVEELVDEKRLIISVIPIKNLTNVVSISPFLELEDYNKIRKKIYRLKMSEHIRQLSFFLQKYLDKNLFEINHTFRNQYDVIHHICKKLLDQNHVEENFELSVLKREAMSASSFFNVIALPHACEHNARKSAVYVIFNKDSMIWEDEKVNIVALITMNKGDSKDFHTIYEAFTKVFSDVGNVRALMDAKDYDSFLHILAGLGDQ